MSCNRIACQEMHRLMVEHLKTRPEVFVANLNSLLEEDGLRLELIHVRATYQNPAQASLYEHLAPDDDEGGIAEFPLRTAEKGVPVR